MGQMIKVVFLSLVCVSVEYGMHQTCEYWVRADWMPLTQNNLIKRQGCFRKNVLN